MNKSEGATKIPDAQTNKEALPEGWALVKVGDVLNLINGFAFKPAQWRNKGLPIIRIQNLNDEAKPFNHCPDKIPQKYLVNTGDLLFAWSGTPGTSFGAHIWHGPRAWLNQHIFRVEFDEKSLYKPFVRIAINHNLNEYIADAQGGVGLAHITKKKFEASCLRLPPITEQRRIVAQVEALLARVNATRERLAKAPAILKRFRQSVLTAAASGQLTADWRKVHSEDDWRQVTLSSLIREKLRNGYSPKPVSYETPIRSLTLSAATSGNFKGEHFKYLDIEVPEDSYLWVKNGDILIQRSNTAEYVGVSAIYEGGDNKYIYPDLMMRIRPNPDVVIPRFLWLALSAESTRNYFRDNATGTAGSMPKINQKIVRSTPVALPPQTEQQEIVRRVEALFALADRIEQRTKAATERVEKTTQSILARAFRGELVETEAELARREGREYESAAQLLARIQAERGGKTSTKPNRARKLKPDDDA